MVDPAADRWIRSDGYDQSRKADDEDMYNQSRKADNKDGYDKSCEADDTMATISAVRLMTRVATIYVHRVACKGLPEGDHDPHRQDVNGH